MKSNAKIAVQKASLVDALLGGYEYEDTNKSCVQSSAVTLTDACGNEVLGARPANNSIPVVETSLPSTLQAGKEVAVSAAAVLIIPANPFRVTALVQNTGSANLRVGAKGVTATTGYRLLPNQTIIYEEPNVNKDEIWAIREVAVDSVAFVQEETVVISESATLIDPDCNPCDDNKAVA